MDIRAATQADIGIAMPTSSLEEIWSTRVGGFAIGQDSVEFQHLCCGSQ